MTKKEAEPPPPLNKMTTKQENNNKIQQNHLTRCKKHCQVVRVRLRNTTTEATAPRDVSAHCHGRRQHPWLETQCADHRRTPSHPS